MSDNSVHVAPTLHWRHRLSAIAALVLLPLTAASLVVSIVRGLPEILVPALFGTLAAWLAWRALTRRGLRRRVYAAAAVVAFAAGVVGLVWGGMQMAMLALTAALAVATAVCAGWALAWVRQPAGRLVGRARHPVLIINPRSGDGVAEREGLAHEARTRGIQVIELGPHDDLAELARHAARLADCIGMAGGDGSLAVVAEQAIRHHIPFVCIPAGTRNHFALDLGLDRSDPVGALDAFGEAVQRRIDVATVNDRMFLNNVSIGAYGEVVASEEYRENKMGVALDRLPSLIGPDAEPLDLRFTDDSGTRRDSAVVIHVSNNSYDLRPLGFGSRPGMDDGELGIVVVFAEQDARPPQVIQWEATSFRVGSGGAIATGVDGEAVEMDPPLEFKIRPQALRVRMARGVAGVSPAAKRPPMTRRTLSRLVDVARGVTPRPEVAGR